MTEPGFEPTTYGWIFGLILSCIFGRKSPRIAGCRNSSPPVVEPKAGISNRLPSLAKQARRTALPRA